MANNYLSYSVAVPVNTSEEFGWLQTHTTIDPDLLEEEELEKMSELFGIEKEEMFDWGWPPGEVDVETDVAYFYSEEGANVENVSLFISAFLREHGRDDTVIIEWAEYCSKPRPGEFGGGASVVNANGYRIGGTRRLAKILEEELLEDDE